MKYFLQKSTKNLWQIYDIYVVTAFYPHTKTLRRPTAEHILHPSSFKRSAFRHSAFRRISQKTADKKARRIKEAFPPKCPSAIPDTDPSQKPDLQLRPPFRFLPSIRRTVR